MDQGGTVREIDFEAAALAAEMNGTARPVEEEAEDYLRYLVICRDAGVEPLSGWEWLCHRANVLSLFNQEGL